MSDDQDPGAASSGGRRRRSQRTKRVRSAVAEQPPFGQPRRTITPTTLVDDDQLEAIHSASLTLLRDHGIEFLHDDARRRLADAGARVEGMRVRFDPEMLMDFVGSAPSSFTLHGRTPAKDLRIGDGHLTFGSVASAPNYIGLDGERRTGDRDGFRDLVKLGQMLNPVHFFGGYPVEAVDLHASIRHLECAYDVHTLSDKAFHIYSLGRERNLDGLEMVRIARGIDDETLDTQPSLTTVINANSPLTYDTPMLEGIIQMASRNQVSIITPFTLAGAMAPITVAGAIVQQNAEALAGICFSQVVRRGAPVIYGGFTSNVDMRSGSPAFGTPEYARAATITGQLCRRYGLPYRSSNVSASNNVDAQAGYESTWALWGAVTGGADLVFHAAGWMEGGLHASYAKMVMDADLLNMVSTYLRPVDTDPDALALEAITAVGPSGHFFGEPHTQARYATEFYSPMVSDWRNWETWTEGGAPIAGDRAAKVAGEILADFEAPPIDDAIAAELRDYVDRRIAEGGVATDF